MDVFISTESRFDIFPDRTVWTTSVFDYSFWIRYLEVFDNVHIIARTREVDILTDSHKRVDGDGVRAIPLPYYIGPSGFLQTYWLLRKTILSIDYLNSAIIARVPGVISNMLLKRPIKQEYPYALEVVGDPYDVFSQGATKHPLRIFFQWWFSKILKKQCNQSNAVSYVTDHYLQERYPCSGYTTGISSIMLMSRDICEMPRTYPEEKNDFSLVFVGTLEELYKAPDILLDAVTNCVKTGFDLRLTIVGDGRRRWELEESPSSIYLGNRVLFTGHLPSGSRVFKELDKADLFVLPSRQEGLPRAMVEAMARGLPCIGSSVGGIPELIGPEFIVPPNDVEALSNKIVEVLNNHQLLESTSISNIRRAGDFSSEVLESRRKRFYTQVKLITEDNKRSSSG